MKIPILWDRSLPEAVKDYMTSAKSYPKRLKEWEAKIRKDPDSNAKQPVKPRQRIQAEEDVNFLRFATALKILVGSSIRIDRIDRAKQLLEGYLLGYSKVSFVLSVQNLSHMLQRVSYTVQIP